MRKLYYSIGISGSGKSFYFKNNLLKDFDEVNTFLIDNNITLEQIKICPDDIRREVCGDVNDHTKEPKVWALARKRLVDTLREYNYAVFDATGVSKNSRKFLKNIRAHKTAIVFSPNIELFKKRIKKDLNEGVDRSNVPDYVVERQFNSFKNSVVKDQKWDGNWNRITEKKIKESLQNEFDDFYFVK